jgi:DNA-binding response OmpR family regulator
LKILVVDDDPAILKLCATALRGQGHNVITCEGGQRALTAALIERFDLALCDINLPDVHGLEIVRAIKMQQPELPVIVISALDPREWKSKSAEAGADFFMQKPLRLDVLRHEVEMAGAAKSELFVVVHDRDESHRQRLVDELRRGGCAVRVIERASIALELEHRPELLIVDAGDPDVHRVVRFAGNNGIACFVLVDAGSIGKAVEDDSLMRAGASLIVQKPVETEALLIQARFLATRR